MKSCRKINEVVKATIAYIDDIFAILRKQNRIIINGLKVPLHRSAYFKYAKNSDPAVSSIID